MTEISNTAARLQKYQRYETWAKDPFWRKGNYTPESVEYLDNWLERMRLEQLKSNKQNNL